MEVVELVVVVVVVVDAVVVGVAELVVVVVVMVVVVAVVVVVDDVVVQEAKIAGVEAEELVEVVLVELEELQRTLEETPKVVIAVSLEEPKRGERKPELKALLHLLSVCER